ncbi:hypothetical protein Pelo_7987 [Pelomyxa schiedti]|nr:hypothetical protein Pelo_7987 [Pelomyxa schiedti]
MRWSSAPRVFFGTIAMPPSPMPSDPNQGQPTPSRTALPMDSLNNMTRMQDVLNAKLNSLSTITHRPLDPPPRLPPMPSSDIIPQLGSAVNHLSAQMSVMADLLRHWGQLLSREASLTNPQERSDCLRVGRELSVTARTMSNLLSFLLPYFCTVDLGSAPGQARPTEPLAHWTRRVFPPGLQPSPQNTNSNQPHPNVRIHVHQHPQSGTQTPTAPPVQATPTQVPASSTQGPTPPLSQSNAPTAPSDLGSFFNSVFQSFGGSGTTVQTTEQTAPSTATANSLDPLTAMMQQAMDVFMGVATQATQATEPSAAPSQTPEPSQPQQPSQQTADSPAQPSQSPITQVMGQLVNMMFGASNAAPSTTAASSSPGNSTITDTIQSMSTHLRGLFPEDDDIGGALGEVLSVIFDSTTLQDTMSIMTGQLAPIQRLHAPLQRWVLSNVGEPTTENMNRFGQQIAEELRTYIREEALPPEAVARVRPGIKLSDVVNNIATQHVVSFLHVAAANYTTTEQTPFPFAEACKNWWKCFVHHVVHAMQAALVGGVEDVRIILCYFVFQHVSALVPEWAQVVAQVLSTKVVELYREMESTTPSASVGVSTTTQSSQPVPMQTDATTTPSVTPQVPALLPEPTPPAPAISPSNTPSSSPLPSPIPQAQPQPQPQSQPPQPLAPITAPFDHLATLFARDWNSIILQDENVQINITQPPLSPAYKPAKN